jgi:hypothetical protein
MPGKNLKQTTQKSEPVVVEATPQKGGKKATATKVETAPVVEATPQKGGKKATATKVEATPVPAKVEATPQKGGKKTPAPKAQPTPAKVEVTATKGVKKAPVTATKAELKGGKKTAAPKTEKKAVKKVETEEVEGEEGDRHVRSFKVRLPGKEEFEGRFTGLTSYQAANKALSKYFRETENPQTKITFSICESTRRSRKAVYSYIGQRQKLDTPVTYKIQDGREIVKNFKNSLKKVKKSEASESA